MFVIYINDLMIQIKIVKTKKMADNQFDYRPRRNRQKGGMFLLYNFYFKKPKKSEIQNVIS